MKQKIEIKNRFTGKIIICGKYESIRECLEKNKDKNFYGANLSGADFSGANFHGANLSWANLSGADFSGANLSRANFHGANLSGADFSGANLSRANFHGEKLDKTPIQILGLKWFVLITKEHIQIGCELHKAKEWFTFDNDRISKMHNEALGWWKQYKPIIKKLWAEHCRKEN